MEKWVLKLRIILWVVLAGVVGWLLYMAVAPSGKISYVYDFSEPNYFIGKLTPKERVETIVCDKETKFPRGNSVSDAVFCSQIIIGDPVYFSLRTPRKFNKAILTLKYKTAETRRGASLLPIIEAGVLVDKIVWRYDLKPIENKIIDQLSLVWDVIEEDGVMFLQREKNYKTIDEFLNNISAETSGNQRSEIALYNYDLKTDFILEDYKSEDTANTAKFSFGYPKLSFNVDYPLRGDWQFYTYIKNEDLDFVFDFQDLNKNKDSDEIDLHLYYNNQLIDSRHLDDGGISGNNDERKDRGKIKLKLANLPEGVYKIELKANDDIITKNITTKQKKLAFINKLWIYGEGNENIKLLSDSNIINAQTINPANLQKIRIGDSELEINKTYKQFSVNAGGGVKEIKLEKDDIILSGNGVFSFNEKSILNPEIKKVDANLDVNKDGINYVLANYKIPRDEWEWKIAEVEFDLTKAYSEDRKYSFLISIPGLRADDDIDDGVEIGEIRVDLEGVSLWEKIKQQFNNETI